MDRLTAFVAINHLKVRLQYLDRHPELLEAAMSAIDRIRAKALQARSIAPDAITAFEADLDSIIAEGPKLRVAKDAAVGQHREAIAGVYGEIDGLKSVIDLMSNGGPPLGGSPDLSAASAPDSADDVAAHSRRGTPV